MKPVTETQVDFTRNESARNVQSVNEIVAQEQKKNLWPSLDARTKT
eukprot:CAMPEP_0185570562 /NCGR_PEP_ID=MMETSP0434-20130131/2832_1 /TAXON_ID=626734 ORGANISM="Favella taraikaensis, Strain Fe Narragansett Bay" /NCGR_SAMPLE_ID=MMETSP0434 /ASSEMBLY_ACC=CAM_ASM_000379 /LENGTH=45 /DNA_ID= /DNA_START= /DNA_END= /DNA_ORIENTATION=